jgi:hypothetical protein
MNDMFGNQTLSTKPSAATPKLASRTAIPNAATMVPGPKYDLVPSMGKQVHSHLKTNPRTKFPEEQGRNAAEDGTWKPGAGAYNHPSMQGKQYSSVKPSAPQYSVSGREAKPKKDVADTQGPGVCRTDSSFLRGKRLTTINSTPQYQFSLDPRFKNKKVHTPGPGAYGTAYSSFGSISSSTKYSSGCFSMGKRFQRETTSAHADQTGPGRCRFDTSFAARSEDNGRNKGYSFPGRYKQPKEALLVPGPGAYGPARSKTFKKGEKGKLKKKKKAHAIQF